MDLPSPIPDREPLGTGRHRVYRCDRQRISLGGNRCQGKRRTGYGGAGEAPSPGEGKLRWASLRRPLALDGKTLYCRVVPGFLRQSPCLQIPACRIGGNRSFVSTVKIFVLHMRRKQCCKESRLRASIPGTATLPAGARSPKATSSSSFVSSVLLNPSSSIWSTSGTRVFTASGSRRGLS